MADVTIPRSELHGGGIVRSEWAPCGGLCISANLIEQDASYTHQVHSTYSISSPYELWAPPIRQDAILTRSVVGIAPYLL